MSYQYQPTTQPEKQKSKIGFILGPLAIIIVLGVVYFFSRQATDKVYNTFKPVSIEITVTSSPSPIPEVTIDPKEYSIAVFNGSGISGQAGEFKTLLEGRGYLVKSTANADKEDYTEVQISAKKTVSSSFITDLKKIISTSFTVNEKTTKLDASAPADLEIVTAPEK